MLSGVYWTGDWAMISNELGPKSNRQSERVLRALEGAASMIVCRTLISPW